MHHLQQAVGGSKFLELPSVQHQDPVRVHDGVQAVRDRQHGALLEGRPHRLLQPSRVCCSSANGIHEKQLTAVDGRLSIGAHMRSSKWTRGILQDSADDDIASSTMKLVKLHEPFSAQHCPEDR